MVEATSKFLRLASLPIRKTNHPKASPTRTPRMPGMGMALACTENAKKKKWTKARQGGGQAWSPSALESCARSFGVRYMMMP